MDLPEIFLRAAETMYEYEPRPVAGDLDGQPDTVIGGDLHAPVSRVSTRARHLGSA